MHPFCGTPNLMIYLKKAHKSLHGNGQATQISMLFIPSRASVYNPVDDSAIGDSLVLLSTLSLPLSLSWIPASSRAPGTPLASASFWVLIAGELTSTRSS